MKNIIIRDIRTLFKEEEGEKEEKEIKHEIIRDIRTLF